MTRAKLGFDEPVTLIVGRVWLVGIAKHLHYVVLALGLLLSLSLKALIPRVPHLLQSGSCFGYFLVAYPFELELAVGRMNQGNESSQDVEHDVEADAGDEEPADLLALGDRPDPVGECEEWVRGDEHGRLIEELDQVHIGRDEGSVDGHVGDDDRRGQQLKLDLPQRLIEDECQANQCCVAPQKEQYLVHQRRFGDAEVVEEVGVLALRDVFEFLGLPEELFHEPVVQVRCQTESKQTYEGKHRGHALPDALKHGLLEHENADERAEADFEAGFKQETNDDNVVVSRSSQAPSQEVLLTPSGRTFQNELADDCKDVKVDEAEYWAEEHYVDRAVVAGISVRRLFITFGVEFRLEDFG